MPPVIGVVAGIIALAGTEVGIAISTTMAMTIATVIVSTGTAMLINGAMTLLRGALGLNKSQGLTISSRNPNAPWRIVYGHTRIAGVVTFLSTTGSNNEYIHMVLTLCRGKVHQVGTMYFDGTAIPVDGGGNGQGQWSGYVHIETDVGDPDNTAQPFPGLASADPGHWTASCLQRGHAKAYVQLKWSQNLFSNGIPNITFDVQGREVYDPRSASVGYSENPALCIADYLQDQTLGLQADPSEVNEGTVIAAANVCDEAVTLKGTITSAARNAGTGHGGTGYVTGDLVSVSGGNGDGALWVAETTAGGVVQKLNIEYPGSGYSDASNIATSGGHGSGLTVDITTFSGTEPQYTSNGAFESTQTPGSLLTDLAGAMAGYITYVQGQFVLCAGAYSSPVASLGDDDLRAPLEVQTRLSRRDLCNAVHGSYLSEANNWQATDYPAIIDGAYVDEDGGTLLWKQLDLPYTISAAMCQRIAKIQLERLRRQVIVTAHCKLTAGAIQPTDVISLTHARFGWTNKTFFVTDVSLATDPDQGDAPALGIDLLLAETDADIYTWSPGNEAAGAQASANIVLPIADAVSSVNGTTGDVTLAPGSNVTLTQAGQTITVAAPLMIGDSGAGGASGTVPAPGAGDAAALKFLKADGTWQTPAGTGGGGSGTVTSVGLTMPSEFTVSGSPVTSSGTLAVSKASESANQVYAGPSSGSAAAPTFRALVANDIPNMLNSTQITADTFYGLLIWQTDGNSAIIIIDPSNTAHWNIFKSGADLWFQAVPGYLNPVQFVGASGLVNFYYNVNVVGNLSVGEGGGGSLLTVRPQGLSWSGVPTSTFSLGSATSDSTTLAIEIRNSNGGDLFTVAGDGTATFSGYLTATEVHVGDGTIHLNAPATTWFLQAWSVDSNFYLATQTAGVNANILIVEHGTGRVGIGNMSPTHLLSVNDYADVHTPPPGDNSTLVATTAFVQNAVASIGGGGGGGGTVTSVGLTMPAEFTVTGSPVTAAGTLAVTKATEPANTVYAGPAASGGVALVQQASNFRTGFSSLTLAYPSANTAGSLLIACIWCRTAPTTPTVTDTAGNTWTRAAGFTGGVLTSIWYACPAVSGANTVTYNDTSGSANNIHLVIEEVTGIVPSGCLDQSGTVTSSVTVATTGSVSQANEWVVGAMGGCCGSVVNPIVPPATATQDAVTYDSSNIERITVAHLTATTGLTGSQSMTFSSSGTNGVFLWGAIATFKAGSAGVAPTFRALVAADIPNIAESQVTNLVSDLAAKAPLASPALTGTATAPTPAPGDNSTKIATTAFVAASVSASSGLVPSMPAPAAAVTIADGTGLLAFGPYILNSGILLTVGSGAGSAVIDIQ